MQDVNESSGPTTAGTNFVVRFWRGEEKLWKAYWLVGLLGGNVVNAVFEVLVGAEFVPATAGFGLTLVYSVWAAVSIWTCAPNCEWKPWGYIARALVIVGVIVLIAAVLSLD